MTETDIKALQPRTPTTWSAAAMVSGRKTFIIRRKQAGKTKIITLGN